MNGMKRLILTVLILIYFGCGSSVKPPQYILIEATGKSPTPPQEAVSVEDGWEFHFPKSVQIQKVAIDHTGKLTELTFYTKTEGRWETIKFVEMNAESPSEIALNVTTDAIRIHPRPAKSGHIKLCRFYVSKPQRFFSIPLEKPPFVK